MLPLFHLFDIIHTMLEKIDVNTRILVSELLASYTSLGYFQIIKAIKDRHVKINNTRIGADCYVDAGDVVHVYVKDREKDHIEIAYSDSNVVVAVKPAGIEVEGEDSFTTRLNAQLETTGARPVHRLDRNTMGLVIYALNDATEKEFLRVFKDREIDKSYHCIVSGTPQKSATLKAYLFKDAKKSMVYISPTPKTGYQPIETQYKFIKKKGELSLLDVKLITGRTHQIRAHLASVKLPIAGDGKYGVNAINKRYKVKQQCLNCYKITFSFDAKSPLHYLDNKVVKNEVELFDLITF